MPNIAFGPSVPNSFTNFINLMDALGTQATIQTFNPLQVTATLGTTTFTIQGTGLSTTVGVNGIYLTGGNITSITVNENGTDTVFLTGAAISAANYHTAVLAEEAAANSPALEAFFGRLGYTYTGTTGADVLLSTARSSDNVLINLSGADTVNLLGGDDNFFLGGGNDTGRGGIGNDSLLGGNGNDSLLGEAGNDFLNGGNNSDALRGGIGNDILTGGAGNDKLYGDAGRDRLEGGAGNDLLVGGAGADRLTGGRGQDTLTGGTERDDFVFATAADMGSGATRDRITDFVSGLDKINLVGLSLDAFINGAAFSGTQAEARFVVSGNSGVLQIDTDGNGTLNASLLLVGVTSLAGTDLLL